MPFGQCLECIGLNLSSPLSWRFYNVPWQWYVFLNDRSCAAPTLTPLVFLLSAQRSLLPHSNPLPGFRLETWLSTRGGSESPTTLVVARERCNPIEQGEWLTQQIVNTEAEAGWPQSPLRDTKVHYKYMFCPRFTISGLGFKSGGILGFYKWIISNTLPAVIIPV